MTRRVRPRRRAAVDGAEVMRTRVVAVLVFLHGASSLRVPATRRSVVTGVVLAAAPAAASAEPRRADAVFDSISQQAPALETRFVEQGYYECPVFSCTTRGASNTNAIFGASIKMKEGDKKEKWISAACCLLFSED